MNPLVVVLLLVRLFGPEPVATPHVAGAAPVSREFGLVELRRELDLDAPIGFVDEDSAGLWLVNERDGVRLGPLTPIPDPSPGSDDELIQWFEGEPGAALMFGTTGVAAARLDGKGAITWWGFEPPPAPKLRRVATKKRDVRVSSYEDEVPTKARIALRDVPGGALIRLTSARVEVWPARAGPDDEPLFAYGNDCRDCTLCKAHVAAAPKPGGGAVLEFEAHESERACQGEDDFYGDSGYGSDHVIRFELAPDGAVRVVSEDSELRGDAGSEASTLRVIDLPNGHLTGRSETTLSSSGAGWTESRWTWRWFDADGVGYVIARHGEELD